MSAAATPWSIYDLATGALLPGCYYGDQAYASANADTGQGVIMGVYDRLSQRVDITRSPPAVVDWQPPAPSNDQWQTWAWDGSAKRWVSAPTIAALRRDRLAPVLAAMAAIDLERIRPSAEAALAAAGGAPLTQAAIAKLNDTQNRLLALRAVYASMNAAVDATALNAITWS